MKKINTNKQKGSALVVAVITIIVIVFIGALGYVFWNNFMNPKTDSSSNGVSSAGGQQEETSESRDQLRKEHAITLASRLFTLRYINKVIPEVSQAGYETFSLQNGQEPLNDPLTKRPYVFVFEQSEMSVGELTFRLYATCDNKISGSDGIGLIEEEFGESIALAIRLESGGYACESSL